MFYLCEPKVTLWHLSFSMDSFFLAEMFKYLFLLFAEEEELPFDVEDYVFTTEAHLLPLSLSIAPRSQPPPARNHTVLHATVLHTNVQYSPETSWGAAYHEMTCKLMPAVIRYKTKYKYADKCQKDPSSQ